RHFHGVVVSFTAGARAGRDLRSHRAVVVPWLWLLTQTASCRVFEDQGVLDIIEAILAGYPFAEYTPALTRSHPGRERCVQYRETDFHFLSRMLEEEGIFYFFRH